MAQKTVEKNGKTKAGKIAFERNGLAVECFFAENGKLQRKIEHWGGKATEFTYQFDGKGHLLKVLRDGTFAEEYTYNQRGQRIEQKREYRGFSDATKGLLFYDEQGRLDKAGDTSFYYDAKGALAERCDCQG